MKRLALFLTVLVGLSTTAGFGVAKAETIKDKVRKEAVKRVIKFDSEILKLHDDALMGDKPVEVAPPIMVKGGTESVSVQKEVIKDLTAIPPSVIRNVVVDKDFKKRILDQEEGLLVSREVEVPMKDVVFLNVHPEVLLTLKFPKEVENAIMSSPGGKVFYRKNNVFVLFPRKGSLYTIKVIFVDGSSVTVVAKRINPLVENAPVVAVVKFYPVESVSPAEALLLYKKVNGFCPEDGDEIAISGKVYKFSVVNKVYGTGDVISACGVNYRVKVE